ncbi:MAG: hypothetical protein MI807_13400 [Verrucomicrobiales bacterium]|nr:hypothetical protein [Verrucomicrobiales bacterium]
MKFASPCLFVDDVVETMKFYKKAFGAVEKFFDPGFGFGMVTIGDSEIGIASHAAGEAMMPGSFPFANSERLRGVELAFYSDDVDAEYSTAIAAGAVSLAAPYDTSWGQRVAYVSSIEGTIIGICSPAPLDDDGADQDLTRLE